MKLLLPCVLALAATPTLAQDTPVEPSPAVQVIVTPSTVHSAIDRGLRFVRAGQDLTTGRYGTGVADTAAVLVAMAESPRKYRLADGPFISQAVDHLLGQKQAGGLIHDSGLEDPTAQVYQALLAGYALEAVEMPGYAGEATPLLDALHAAAAERAGEDYSGLWAFARSNGGPVPAAMLGELLASQAESGAFGSDLALAGQVRTLRRLTATWSILREAEVKPATDVNALPDYAELSRTEALAAMRRGAAYLTSTEAMETPGRWGSMGHADPGITAMVLGALATLPEPRGEAVDTAIDAGVEWLLSLQKEDGSIHAGQLQNYVTAASVKAFATLGWERLDEPIGRARIYLTQLQADEGEGYAPSHRYYGGVGYGGDERPDMSNLQMAVEALAAAGADGDDPAMQKALEFLQRSQNRKESNDLVIESPEGDIVPGDDGGGTYTPGNSKAGFLVLEDGTRIARSYGSMTFALLKSYLLAGLSKDDPRVQAAYGWIQDNYTLELNPGFEASSDPGAAYQGLFYYFLAMSRALELMGGDVLVTSDGTRHDWRSELTGRLASMQLPDGSWVNRNSARWYEGNPTLATAYALQCLGPVITRE